MKNIKKKINFFIQDFNKQILGNIENKLKKDIWVNGSYVKKLEKNLEKYFNTKKKISTCNSGSDALLLALLLDKHSTKDIYITTPFSYIASSSIAKFLNLNIIYIDIAKDNFLLDLTLLENFLLNCPKKIKKRIRGIINVEIFGQTNDLSRLNKIAKKYKLTLIGDCAQSFGTIYKKRFSINYYDYSSISFYPTKIFSCYGDGGAVLMNKKKIKEATLLKNNGHEIFDKDNCKILGFNSRLDNIQAYVLFEKLKKIKNLIRKRTYNSKFLEKNNPLFLKLPRFDKNIIPNNYIYSAYINKNKRSKFINYMLKNKIECTTFYKKLLNQNNVLKPFLKTKLSNAILCSKSLVCIPNHENLNKKELLRISSVINSFKNSE